MVAAHIAVIPPLLNEDLCLLQAVEDLSVQALVPELAVKALVVAVLPGTAGLDEQRPGTHLFQPAPQQPRGYFRPIVRADVFQHAMHQHGIRQRVDDMDQELKVLMRKKLPYRANHLSSHIFDSFSKR